MNLCISETRHHLVLIHLQQDTMRQEGKYLKVILLIYIFTSISSFQRSIPIIFFNVYTLIYIIYIYMKIKDYSIFQEFAAFAQWIIQAFLLQSNSWPKTVARKWLNLRSGSDEFHSDYNNKGIYMFININY